MGEILPDGTIQGYYTKCNKCGSEIPCNIQGGSSHVCFEYLAVISGGIGPNVWDKEVTVYAKDIVNAARMIEGKLASDASIIAIEQVD